MMIYVCLVDNANKQILHPYEYEDGDSEADERFRGLDAQAFLTMRDHGGDFQAYRGDQPFEFLPETIEEVTEAMVAADDSGVSATEEA
jgi:hypothetical protein